MRIGSLFSGIGGLELGLERAGCGEVVWQCEADPFARRVLAKHWPGVPIYEDVRSMGAWLPVPDVDIICGGFPCQDISTAGKGAGLDGTRSGLFFELARIVRVVRPRYLVLENVSAILARGGARVLGEVASLGYDAWWDCVPASAVGAPHRRDRWFCVAWLADAVVDLGVGGRLQRWAESAHRDVGAGCSASGGEWPAEPGVGGATHGVSGGVDRPFWPTMTAGDAKCSGSRSLPSSTAHAGTSLCDAVYARGGRVVRPREAWERDVPRTASPKTPDRRNRIRVLGNAVCPPVATAIGRVLVELHRHRQTRERHD